MFKFVSQIDNYKDDNNMKTIMSKFSNKPQSLDLFTMP